MHIGQRVEFQIDIGIYGQGIIHALDEESYTACVIDGEDSSHWIGSLDHLQVIELDVTETQSNQAVLAA